MKTREQVFQEIQALNKKHLLLALPTGLGKSKIALDLAFSNSAKSILIVYPKINLKQNWIDEVIKWGYKNELSKISFTTYNSLHKYADEAWDTVIFDEGHHITERVLEIIGCMHVQHAYILSATIKPTLKYKLEIAFPGLYNYRMRMQEAINSDILPDPTVVLIPLTFNTVDNTETIVKNPKATNTLTIPFNKRFSYVGKTVRYLIPCTEAQYYTDLDSQVEYYKKKAMCGNQVMKNLWLHKAGERLKWLASKKTRIVFDLLNVLQKERTLTFCGSIEQTELLGQHCIHSKNRVSLRTLQDFNEGKINHITAIAMLDEGQNLVNCRIGIFANINSSDRIQIQRIGRILRHPKPIIIIPYFKHSREEEIVSKMLESYNKNLVRIVQPDLKQLQL